MATRQLQTSNKIFTPKSTSTLYIDYSPQKSVLEVAFTGNSIYHYKSVPEQIWKMYKQVITSGGPSGTFVNSCIKPVYLNYEEVKL